MKTWTCQQVGECCQQTPGVTMTLAEAKIVTGLADRAARPLTWTERPEHGFVTLIAAPCPFYKNGCAIYESRPYNCRRGGCFRWFPRTEAFANDPMPRINADRDLKRSYAQQQRKAQRWAVAHGWKP